MIACGNQKKTGKNENFIAYDLVADRMTVNRD